MSFDIGAVQRLQAVQAAARTSRTNEPAQSNPTASADAVKVELSGIPHTPPAEVLDAMSVAAAAHDRLTASGHGLSFKIDDATGKVVVTVHDTHGKVLFSVPAAKALDIAAGGTLDQYQ